MSAELLVEIRQSRRERGVGGAQAIQSLDPRQPGLGSEGSRGQLHTLFAQVSARLARSLVGFGSQPAQRFVDPPQLLELLAELLPERRLTRIQRQRFTPTFHGRLRPSVGELDLAPPHQPITANTRRSHACEPLLDEGELHRIVAEPIGDAQTALDRLGAPGIQLQSAPHVAESGTGLRQSLFQQVCTLEVQGNGNALR